MNMNVEAVIGANYGDEGKGLFTDYLCNNIDNIPLIIMTNGGSQRGHTVELKDGTRHVFHHFGSGTLRNAYTYFPKQYLLNPMQFVKEYNELNELGYKPISYHNPNCIVQLPCDIALNWHIEKSRGEKKHGSVGCGIWETKYRIYDGDAYTFDKFCKLKYVEQVNYIKYQAKKYRDLRCKEENISKYADIYDLFLCKGFIDHFISDCITMNKLCKSTKLYDIINTETINTLVFECGQGLKLDQFYGASDESNTTPSFTGAIGIANILNEENIYCNNINLNYISRTYLTKHGAGKFIEENEDDYSLYNRRIVNSDKTNVFNEWQGGLRFAVLNYNELFKRCNRDVDMFKKFFSKYSSLKHNIVMTHANEIDINERYLGDISYISNTKFSKDIIIKN